MICCSCCHVLTSSATIFLIKKMPSIDQGRLTKIFSFFRFFLDGKKKITVSRSLRQQEKFAFAA